MVNTEVPKHYAASPSSYSGTPHLTINHGAALDLDSSNAFEGPEKLLEVWFSPSPAALPPLADPAGLKVVPAKAWQDMLDLVNCKVLSVVESEHVDAYLLSESSMFVFPHKLILKTCGTTTLLCGLPRILELAALIAGFPHTVANYEAGQATAAHPYRVFYSRKNFLFPDRQRGPHRSWRDEVKALDRLFLGGSAYVIGKLNGEHWYLYLTEPNTLLTPPSTPEGRETEIKVLELPAKVALANGINPGNAYDDDETLEILMTDLDPKNAQQFYLDHASAVAEGRFYERAHEARMDAERHIGTLADLPTSGSAPSTVKTSAATSNNTLSTIDEEDIFSNTSSDPCDLNSSEYEQFSYPQELTTEGHSLGTVVSEYSGLSDLYPTAKYPDARIDAYLFTPCGFSANGVVPDVPSEGKSNSNATHYFTVHVTPEANCSYASFETNVPHRQSGRETADVIAQVVNIFKPSRFSVTLFEGKNDMNDSSDDEAIADLVNGLATDHDGCIGAKSLRNRKSSKIRKKDSPWETIPGYRRLDRIVHDLDGYDLVFKYFEKVDWPANGHDNGGTLRANGAVQVQVGIRIGESEDEPGMGLF